MTVKSLKSENDPKIRESFGDPRRPDKYLSRLFSLCFCRARVDSFTQKIVTIFGRLPGMIQKFRNRLAIHVGQISTLVGYSVFVSTGFGLAHSCKEL